MAMNKRCDDNKDNYDCHIEKIIFEPYSYICSSDGKGLRDELLSAFNVWLMVPKNILISISKIINMLHNASLMIDDIQDNSDLRRGKPAAHCIFGVPLSINAANYVYFLALKEVENLKSTEAINIFTEEMLKLHKGQGMDIYWRTFLKCPTEAEYETMVCCKTGGLFGLGVRLMQLFSENKTDFKPLWETLAIFFQIRDDYANLADISYHKLKTFAEDITEGKVSYPVIRAIKDHPDDYQVLAILSQRSKDLNLKIQCVQHMLKLGALQSTVEMLHSLETKCHKCISDCGGNSKLTKFVDTLSSLYKDSAGQLKFVTLDDLHESLQSASSV